MRIAQHRDQGSRASQYLHGTAERRIQMRSKSGLLTGLWAAVAISFGIGGGHAADIPTKAVSAVPDLPLFFVVDNRLTFAYEFSGTQPGITSKTAKQVYAFTHFDVWAYGTNFANLSLSKSDKSDPAAPCADFTRPWIVGCAGATEFYGVLRSTFGFNQIFDTKMFTIGPLQNVSFEVGANVGTINDLFAASDRNLYAGLQFAFNLPYRGYFNVAPMLFKNFTHIGYSQCGYIPAPCLNDGNTEYNTTWTVETNYYMDLGFLPKNLQYFSISGRAAWTGPRGYEEAPLVGTQKKIELNSEPVRLTLDASKAFWGEKYSHNVDIWVAYRYWQNKFGLDRNNSLQCTAFAPGSCTEKSLYSGITVKF